MNIRDIKTKSTEELLKLLHEKQASVLNFRFRVSGGRVKNVSELRETRKDIARVLTLLKAESPEVTRGAEGPERLGDRDQKSLKNESKSVLKKSEQKILKGKAKE